MQDTKSLPQAPSAAAHVADEGIPAVQKVQVCDEHVRDSWMRHAYEAAEAVAWEWNLEDGVVTWSNEFFHVYGIDPGVPLHVEDWLERLHPADRIRLRAELRRFFGDAQRDAFDIELRIVRGGEVRWLNSRGQALRGACGRRTRLAGLTIDTTERRRLERDALDLSAREQRRIGYELHDELCQQLTGIHIKSQVLRGRLAQDRPEHVRYLERIVDLVDKARLYTRNLSRTLTPILVEGGQLAEALTQFAADASVMYEVDCRFQKDSPRAGQESTDQENAGVATQLYRIAEEAVRWAVQERRAAAVLIELKNEPGCALVVRDDGRAPAEDMPSLQEASALRVMQLRAASVGAEVWAELLSAGGLEVGCRFAWAGPGGP